MGRLKYTVGPVRPAADAGLGALDDVARGRVASAAAAAPWTPTSDEPESFPTAGETVH